MAAREQVGGAVAATSPARLGCLVGLWGMRRMLVCSSCALIAHGTRSLWTSRNAKAASALTLAHMWHFPVGRHGYWFPGLESAHPALFEHGEITDLRLENCAKPCETVRTTPKKPLEGATFYCNTYLPASS